MAPEAITRWEAAGVGKRGGQLQYSDVAIETALTLRLLFHLPLRQTEGFLRSIFGMLGLDLSAPDHTTLSRRAQRLNLTLRRVLTGTGIHLIVDSTGLSMVGDREWAAVKHGSRGTRGWKKLHLGVDGTGVIVAHALTGGHVDDATTALDLINTVEGDVSWVLAPVAVDRSPSPPRSWAKPRVFRCLHRSLLIRQPASEPTASSASAARLCQFL